MEALVELDRSRPGLGDQLAVALREAISAGRLAAGTRLPSSRDLAADLRLSRGVVVAAYEQLIAEGRLVSRRGSGTWSRPVAVRSPRPHRDRPRSAWSRRAPAAAPGLPDLSMFPRTAWRRAYERALAAATRRRARLRRPRRRPPAARRAGRATSAGCGPPGSTAGDLVMTTGAAQAFAMWPSCCRSPGRDADRRSRIRAAPASAATWTRHGLRLVPIPVDGDGLDVDALARTGVPAVLVTPAHQFPTGVVLAPAPAGGPGRLGAADRRAGRRGRLRRGVPLRPRPGRLPPGPRPGRGRAPRLGQQGARPGAAARLARRTAGAPGRGRARIKAAADLGGPVLEQLAFADLLATGGYDRHLRRARRTHRQRRDALVAALGTHLPGARVSGIAAGLHLVVELPAGVDDVALAARAAGGRSRPGRRSRRTRLAPDGPPGLVLGYAAHTPDQLTAAVERLARLVTRLGWAHAASSCRSPSASSTRCWPATPPWRRRAGDHRHRRPAARPVRRTRSPRASPMLRDAADALSEVDTDALDAQERVDHAILPPGSSARCSS